MNNIEEFFDSKASGWDAKEKITKERLNQLLDLLPIKDNMKICDLGCGTGIITGLLKQRTNCKVIGIDLSSNMIKIAKEKYKDVKDIEFRKEDFYLNKEKFDFIVIYNAYPHFLDTKKLNEVLYNSLNKDGYFAILHSLSRQHLTNVHSSCNDISFNLSEVNIEASKYKDNFNIIQANEDDSSYLIICQKK